MTKDLLNINELKHLTQIQEFVKGLEKGDLVLDELIQYGYGVYGQTKTGKTALSRLLAGDVLTGTKINGRTMVQAASNKFKAALIGNNTNSQTEIPNVLKTKTSKHQTHILDTPGYGDTYGVLRIFSNAFYHYRLYSNVQNMKFILCFQKNQLQTAISQFASTIEQFNSYFKFYAQKKQTIWQSCCFLITKVEEDDQTEAILNIKSQLINISKTFNTELTPQKDKLFKDFIQFIVKNNQIFIVQAIKIGQVMECKGLLQKIDSKITKWWSRKMLKNNTVDMNQIVFSLAKQIQNVTTSNSKAKEQFKELVRYYYIKIRQILNADHQKFINKNNIQQLFSLGQVIDQLVQDSMGAPQSHNFIKIMNSYVKKNYNNYDQNYNNLRQKKQKQIFSLKLNQVAETTIDIKKNQKDKNYVVKKFKAIQQIQLLKNKANQFKIKTRSPQTLNQSQQILYKVIKELNRVCYKKQNSSSVIYKYGYLVHRVVEQFKIFSLLFEIPQTQTQLRKNISALNDQKGFDFQRQFIDFMGVDFYYNSDVTSTYKKIHQLYVQDFEIDDQNFKKINVNGKFLQFFTKDIQINDNISKKICKLILQYSDRFIKESKQNLEFTFQQKKFLIRKLTQSRVISQNIINKIEQDEEKLQQVIILRRISQNLAKLLEMSQQYNLAKQVYKSIHFVQSVCEIFNKQIKQSPQDINLRIQYSRYLAKHWRQQDGIKVLQKAYQIIKKKEHLQVIRDELIELRNHIKTNYDQYNSQYEQLIFNRQYFTFFEDLQIKILDWGWGKN